MKYLKKTVLVILCLFPHFVYAGSLSINNPIRLSDNKYAFTLEAKEMELNYINGRINVTNGTITKVTMSNGWINKTGTNNNFYFYKDGISKGSYLLATFEVTTTGNSEYSISEFQYGKNLCKQDNYGNRFGKNGNIVNDTLFKNECEISNDATLKNLTPNVGELSPVFASHLNNYNLRVNQDINVITFHAIPTSEKAKIISGTHCNLNKEVTDCKIKVEAESGLIKTYTIHVYKEHTLNQPEEVQNFKVYNGTIDTPFNEKNTNYRLTPDKNAEYIYFGFDINGLNYISPHCSTLATTCSLTMTINSQKQTYTFTILGNEENAIEESSKDSNTSIAMEKLKEKKKTTTPKNKVNTNESTKNEETKKTEEEPTIDPIEYNKENKKDDKIEEIKTKANIKPHKENKERTKSYFVIILSFVNIFIGICIGLFIKKKTPKK